MDCRKCKLPLEKDDMVCASCGTLVADPDAVEAAADRAQAAERRKPFIFLGVLALLAVGGAGIAWQTGAFKAAMGPTKTDLDVAGLEAAIQGGDAKLLPVAAGFALFDVRQLPNGPEALYTWELRASKDVEKLRNALRDKQQWGIVDGIGAAYEPCVKAQGATHEDACVSPAAKWLQKNLLPALTDHMAADGYDRAATAKLLGGLAAAEPKFLEALAVALVPWWRDLDAVANARPTAFLTDADTSLGPQARERAELLLAMNLVPPAGAKSTRRGCEMRQDKFAYPDDCLANRALSEDVPATAANGRYSYWDAVTRFLGNRRAVDAFGLTERAASYLSALGQDATLAAAFADAPGVDAQKLAAVPKPDERAVDSYLVKLKEIVDGMAQICDEIEASAPGPALPKELELMTPAGTKLTGDKLARITVVNKFPKEIDPADLPGMVGKVRVIYFNEKAPRETFARVLEVNDAASFNIVPGKYKVLYMMDDVNMGNINVTGFCHIVQATVKPGTYLEEIEIGGGGDDAKKEADAQPAK